MPDTRAPSLTLAIEVPDYHSLAKRFEHSGIPQLTCGESRAIANRRIDVPADAIPRAIEVAVAWSLSDVLPSRHVIAKAVTGSLGEVFVFDPHNRRCILVGQFAAVEADVERVAA